MDEPAFLLDTDICIYVVRGVNERLKARLAEQDADALAISAITLAELELGIRTKPDQRGRLEMLLDRVRICPFDDEAARSYAQLPFRRARFDRLIAAHALSLGLPLVTNNGKDFADIPGLKIENWTL